MDKVTQLEVIEHVKQLLKDSEKEITSSERKEQHKYALLIENSADKNLLSRMLDESSQIRDNRKLARRIKHLLEHYGTPSFFNAFDTFLIKAFVRFAYLFDFISVPIFKKKLRQETAKVIIDEKESVFFRHLRKRKEDKIGQNVNLLGEVVLGDSEADFRYHHYLEALENPQINYISIKISGIYAQISALNYEENRRELCRRIAAIYRKAIEFPYVEADGRRVDKFVNLDMEEYKDTQLTLDVFRDVLSMPEFKNYRAGIVVQTYLPDAWNFQTLLLDFARRRVEAGGAPLKIRLVKGANLGMETVISSLKGWENPIYDSKVEVDANYLHLLDRALLPENAAVMHIGVASHNLFTISYAYLLSKRYGVEDALSFEMLEGMANYLPRVLKSINKHIILYTPVVKDENFLNAVSYLVRRLDENTGKDNFLSYSFGLRYGSKAWDFLRNQFEEAIALKDKISVQPRRTQDRNQAVRFTGVESTFVNEPDTNFDLQPNREWAMKIHDRWMKTEDHTPYRIPVMIGEASKSTGKLLAFNDHNQGDRVTVCEAHLATLEDVKAMMLLAEKDPTGWSKLPLADIKQLLHRTAVNISNKRGDLIGCMSAITGKTFYEGDVEVSEAIDFCRYYPLSLEPFAAMETISISPKGVVMVIPPWNFPTAIPVGGVVAALAGGNRVILKPATVAYPIAWEFVQCFWEAGVPHEALQLVCADGREPLNFLTTHPALKQIIFTGGTDTAMKLIEQNIHCPVSAETGGKNAMIVSSKGDRDHAILNVLSSAFSNAGQKCSACSLLILEKDVYDDLSFREKLRDAVLSLHAGSAWDHANIVGPMVSPPNDKLEKAFELENGESWLVEPVFADEKRYVLKPTVKWGVKKGHYCFDNELFAPVLSVVRAENFEQAIALANSTEYGLTSGLQSLDEEEHKLWKEHIEAGNLYINRGITGAIVSRQPFGGMKRSAFGPGIKAGGPNYAVSFMNITPVMVDALPALSDKTSGYVEQGYLQPDEAARLELALQSYQKNWEQEFSVERDIHHIHGESNHFRYLPVKKMMFRIQENDTLEQVLMVVLAANITRTNLYVSCSSEHRLLQEIANQVLMANLVIETEESFLSRMMNFERIRTTTDRLPEAYFSVAAANGVYLATATPMAEGRVELLHYLREQSVSYEYHRYGSIVED